MDSTPLGTLSNGPPERGVERQGGEGCRPRFRLLLKRSYCLPETANSWIALPGRVREKYLRLAHRAKGYGGLLDRSNLKWVQATTTPHQPMVIAKGHAIRANPARGPGATVRGFVV